MSDGYQRVDWSTPVGWFSTPSGPAKVVPADAIVIERGDLPEVEVHLVDEFYVDGFVFSRNKDVSTLRDELLVRLALIEYLTEHPPIDEAQVKAMAPLVHAALEASGGCRDGWDSVDVTRALIRHGVVKPEPTP